MELSQAFDTWVAFVRASALLYVAFIGFLLAANFLRHIWPKAVDANRKLCRRAEGVGGVRGETKPPTGRSSRPLSVLDSRMVCFGTTEFEPGDFNVSIGTLSFTLPPGKYKVCSRHIDGHEIEIVIILDESLYYEVRRHGGSER